MQIPRTHTIDSEIRFQTIESSSDGKDRTMRKIVTMAMLCTVATVGSESRLTNHAPYSAEAVTESVQLLADGNRIVTKNTTHIFRDSEGRTRREQLNAAGTDVVSVNITDPSSGTTY